MRISNGGGGPSISRRRGTRGKSGGGVAMPLSLKALVVLGMICVSIFALGLILGARAVVGSEQSPSSSSSALEDGKPSVAHAAHKAGEAAEEIHRLVAESARAEAIRLKEAAQRIGKGLRGRKGRGGDGEGGGRVVLEGANEVDIDAGLNGLEDGGGGGGGGGLNGGGGGHHRHEGVPSPDDPNYNPHHRIDDDDARVGGSRGDGGDAKEDEDGGNAAAAEGATDDAPAADDDDPINGSGANNLPAAQARKAAAAADNPLGKDLFPPSNDSKPPFPSSYLPSPLPPHRKPDFSAYRPLGGDRFDEWKDGSQPYAITPELMQKSDDLARSRRGFVKAAMKHAWTGYKKYAFGKDELKPQSKKNNNNWGGMGTTLVDSLDTLWLMGMKEEFTQARDWVRDHLDHDHVNKAVSVFETTIRSLGGLLSAYDWSGDKVFLEKADDLGGRLFKSFSSESGIPFGAVNLNTGKASNFGWAGNNAILSEFTTIQLEYRYLARATGKRDYAAKTERVFELMKSIEPEDGLYPLLVRNRKSKPEFANAKISFGAMGDSMYEYMLKVWLQSGKRRTMYREMYDKSIQGMHDHLLQRSEPNGLTYIADRNNGKLDHKMDHLVCFMGGLLALGAYHDPLGVDSDRAKRDLRTARELTYTCYQMYARTKTGISPEWAAFSHRATDFEPGRGGLFYILRPETVESLFVLNKLTGDPIYREWGWEIFQSIERYCKTDVAYGSLKDVNNPSIPPEDRMESFFLAETMKYLYLLFDPDTEVDIVNKHVFNTEAHPTRIFPEFDKSDLALKQR